MSDIPTNYIWKLQTSQTANEQFKQISVLNFVPKLVHEFEYDRFRWYGNTTQTFIDGKIVLTSLQKR